MINDMQQSVIEFFGELEIIDKLCSLQLETGDYKWEDEPIQYVIPVLIGYTNWDWLEKIAENNLVEEGCKVVKNFIAHCKSLCEVNSELLKNSIHEVMRRGQLW